MKRYRTLGVFQGCGHRLEYTGVSFGGPIPLYTPYFNIMKSRLDLNWHNVLLLAIL